MAPLQSNTGTGRADQAWDRDLILIAIIEDKVADADVSACHNMFVIGYERFGSPTKNTLAGIFGDFIWRYELHEMCSTHIRSI